MIIAEDRSLARTVFSGSAQRVWSIVELVTELNVSSLSSALSFLSGERADFNRYQSSDIRISEEDIDAIRQQCEYLRDEICAPLNLRYASTLLARVLDWLTDGSSSQQTFHVGYAHLSGFLSVLIQELGETNFYGLSPDRARYYASADQFGLEAYQSFPSAQTDIVEAMRCLALEVNTAAVFHLMRIAEHGLRALAVDCQVTAPKGGLELATWEQVIRELEDSESKIFQYPKTAVREQQFAFYHGAMMEIRRFKNVWRNNIMHAREHYDREQAMSAFNHVREFMKILASRISEVSAPLPEIWGTAQEMT